MTETTQKKIIRDDAAIAATSTTAVVIGDQQQQEADSSSHKMTTANVKQVSFTMRDSPALGPRAEGEGDRNTHQSGGDHLDGHKACGGCDPPHHSDHQNHQHHHHHHAKSLSDQMPWYTPPIQRQRWDEEQLAPHTEWCDIFFDLFYVASAYNLGNLLREDPTTRGLLYLCGCFLPLMGFWTSKTYFDARFLVHGNDVFHQCYDVAAFLAVATAALHIRPVAILSNPVDNFDMFAFSLSICLASLLYLGRLLEIAACQGYFQTKGLYPEALSAVRRETLPATIAVLFYMASVIYLGIQYDGQLGGDRETANGEYAKEENASLSSSTPTGSHRSLASGETPSYSDDAAKVQDDDVAVWLLLIGVVICNLTRCLSYLCFRVDFKKKTVPLNVGYIIHRYGEFVMLLLGESVLSLLIADLNEGYEYYQTFFAGVITVILMQYLHFQSHSHDPDKHAMRRSVYSATGFYIAMFVYASSLIILGTCYKMFMMEFKYEKEGYNDDPEEGSSHRRKRMLFQALLFSPQQERSLAGGASAALRFSTQERQERIAHFFSGSLAMVWLCLDLIIVAHRGLADNLARIQETGKLRLGAIAMVCLRVGLILFAATLSQYIHDPTTLSFLGMAGIVGQLLLRACGTFFLPPDKDDEEEQEAEALDRMAGYVAARLRGPKQSDHGS